MKELQNQKGQVAIFIALIFQVLFLFFAAVINVGLLVHHKINLQNSVDLAAYYGGMKQAEMLNTIAHINYQIRQSWKLMSWRYRVLGSAGDFDEHPYDKTLNPPGPRNGWAHQDAVPTGTAFPNFYKQPAFCITFVPFQPMPPDENTCKNVSNANSQGITLFKPNSIIAGFIGLTHALQSSALTALDNIQKRGKVFGSYNYYMLGNFYLEYVFDVGYKKTEIIKLSQSMSESNNDFTDLDGESVKKGVENTLKANLTAANREQVTFELYNSLGNSTDCGGTNGDPEKTPPNWLKEIKILPGLLYADTIVNSNVIVTRAKNLFTENGAANMPTHFNELQSINPALYNLIQTIQPYMGLNPAPRDPSLGYEKNPKCVAYVGVTAISKPKIPFSPIMGVYEMKAMAVAKPFGGRIGPWYTKKWMDDSNGSGVGSGENDPNKVDIVSPPRLPFASADTFSNYSRYPGDKIGVQSSKVLYQYGKAIYEIGGFKGQTIARNPGQAGVPIPANHGDEPNFSYWDDVGKVFDSNQGMASEDPLSWSPNAKKDSMVRKLELSAVAPDLFDITYYSIEPDFYNNYYVRMKEGFFKNKKMDFLRRDFGSRVNDPQLQNQMQSFGIKDQIASVRKEADTMGDNAIVDFNADLTYIVKNMGNTLTAWMTGNWIGENYSSPKTSENAPKFAHCNNGDANSDSEQIGGPDSTYDPLHPPAPGSCAGTNQGRTGFSVRLQSINGFQNSIKNGQFLDNMKTFTGYR